MDLATQLPPQRHGKVRLNDLSSMPAFSQLPSGNWRTNAPSAWLIEARAGWWTITASSAGQAALPFSNSQQRNGCGGGPRS